MFEMWHIVHWLVPHLNIKICEMHLFRILLLTNMERKDKSSFYGFSLSKQNPALTSSVSENGVAFKVFFHLVLPHLYLTLEFFQSITDQFHCRMLWFVSQVPPFMITFPEQSDICCVNRTWSSTAYHCFQTRKIVKYSCCHFHSHLIE